MVSKISFYVFLFSLFSTSFLFSQASQPSDITSEFQIAVSLFDAQQFPEALKIFEWVKQQPENSKTTVAYLFAAKIFLAQNVKDSAEQVLREFLEKFPGSKYYSEAEVLLAETLKQREKAEDAVFLLASSFEGETRADYVQKKKDFIQQIVQQTFSLEQTEKLLAEHNTGKLAPLLLYCLAQKNMQKSNRDEAARIYTVLLKEFPDADETSMTANLFAHSAPIKLTRPANNSEKVVVALLPLTTNGGAANVAASEVLEGIKYAVHEYNVLSGNGVALLVRDTKRDSSEIQKLENEFAERRDFAAIIGPLYSDETRMFLKEAAQLNVSVISPTATDPNLAPDQTFFYQANTSMGMHGRIMAEYLYYVENKHTIVSLFPKSGNASTIGKDFVEAFERLGGKVTYREYQSGTGNTFEPALNLLKKNIAAAQGLFLPINDNMMIPVILSSLVKAEINLPIYGNQDWFTTKGLETSSSLSEKLTFTTDNFVDFEDEDDSNFSKKFSEVTNEELTSNNLYGYDAAKFLIKMLKESAKNGKPFEEEVAGAEAFEGIHNAIKFGKGRVNQFLNIVRFHEGKFERIERFKFNPKEGKK